MLFIQFLFLLLVNVNVNAQVSPTDTYLNSLTLVKPDVYFLYWNYTSDSIIAEIHVKTQGWVSFGITIGGELDKSDLIVAWVTDERIVKFADCYVENNQVFVDNLQNWDLVNATQTAGYTIVKFTRKIYLCDVDTQQDLNIETGTPYVSYAWGDTDPKTRFVGYFTSNRGVQPVPLISARQTSVTPSSQTIFSQTLNMSALLTNDEFTTYKCRLYNFANLWGTNITFSATKRHLIRFTTRLPANDYLRDWVMYECSSSFSSSSYTLFNSATCGLADDNDWATILNNECSKIVLLWTRGNNLVQEFPSTIGYPFGGSSSSSRFYIFRLHYENPDLDRDVSHAISLLFTYTSTFRANEAGTLTVGSRNSITGLVIPPGTQEITLNSYCASGCMNAMIPSFNDMRIFATTPYTYGYSTQLYTKLIRSGSEFAFVSRNKHFNNSYLYTQFLQTPVVFKNGDQLVTTCKYKTEGETNFLYGPDDETCIDVLYYYPRNPSVSYCYSQPTVNSWITFLRELNSTGKIYEQNLNIGSGNGIDVAKAENIISQIIVDNSIRSSFQTFYDNANHTQFCGVNNLVSTILPIKVSSTLKDVEQCVLGNDASTSLLKPNLLLLLLLLLILNV